MKVDSKDRVRCGMFIMPFHPASKSVSQCIDEDLELVVRAEELGFEEFWIGEHHTMKLEPIVMPEIFIARALGDTHTIRMGPAPVCINQHHPAAVAGRLAFLDHLSRGRLNLCLGHGSSPSDQELFGVDPKLGSAMAEEAIEIILKLWSSDPPYEIDGKFWKIHLKKTMDAETLLGYVQKPFQKPHPPIAIPGMSLNSPSMRMAGRKGYSPFAHCLIAGNVVADLWATYAMSAQAAGRSPDRNSFRVARSIFLADTTREAVQLARRNQLGQCFEYVGQLLDKGIGRRLYKRDPEMSDTDCNLDYLMKEQIIAGDPGEVLRRLLELWQETGGFGQLILMGYDWDDKARWLHSMELFAKELMPALNKAVG